MDLDAAIFFAFATNLYKNFTFAACLLYYDRGEQYLDPYVKESIARYFVSVSNYYCSKISSNGINLSCFPVSPIQLTSALFSIYLILIMLTAR